jgi:carboxyl-terminal processing protease
MRAGTALVIIVPLLVVVGAFVLVASRGAGAAPAVDGVYWNEDVARFVRRRVAMTYVDELDEARSAELFHRAMDAYVRSLDPHCDFIPPEEHRRWREGTRGEYAGLGIKVREVAEGLVVIGVLPGGPAAVAGLAVGDTIASAGGVSLAGMKLEEVERTNLLKGAPQSVATLQVLRGPRPTTGPPPGPPVRLEVRRAVVRPPTVFARRAGAHGEYGVVRLTEFSEATGEDFDAALDAMVGSGVKGVVLDLRHNGGGVLPTAVGVASRFLSRGVIVRSEGRTRHATQVYTARPDVAVPDTIALVVLVDHRSASASEVVAGALQDHRRALLVGERTYGKFVIQQITEIPGYDAAVKLTTSRYYLPSGRSYQRTAEEGEADEDGAGILPDVVLELTKAERESLFDAWENEEAAPWGQEPPHPEVPADAVDPQLRRALDVLEGQGVLSRIRRPGG